MVGTSGLSSKAKRKLRSNARVSLPVSLECVSSTADVDDKPAKPPTPYHLWYKANYRKISADIGKEGSCVNGEVSKKASVLWKALPLAAKSEWQAKVNVLKKQYDDAMEVYKATLAYAAVLKQNARDAHTSSDELFLNSSEISEDTGVAGCQDSAASQPLRSPRDDGQRSAPTKLQDVDLAGESFACASSDPYVASKKRFVDTSADESTTPASFDPHVTAGKCDTAAAPHRWLSSKKPRLRLGPGKWYSPSFRQQAGRAYLGQIANSDFLDEFARRLLQPEFISAYAERMGLRSMGSDHDKLQTQQECPNRR